MSAIRGPLEKRDPPQAAECSQSNLALLVSHRGLDARTIGAEVQTTQIAPTILKSLGLDPRSLDGVRDENTQVLPGIGELAARND